MEGEKLDKERKTERELWKSWRRGKMMKKNRRKKEMGIEWVTVGIVGSIQVGGMEGEKETEKRQRDKNVKWCSRDLATVIL